MKVKLERRRNYPYTLNCPVTKKTYKWAGSIKGKTQTIEVSEDTYNYLNMQTTAIRGGALCVIEDEAKEDLKLSMTEEELKDIENNSHTREEIEKILNGNTNTLKGKLKEITNIEEKRFVVDVATSLNIDSLAKQKALNEWYGVEIDFEK